MTGSIYTLTLIRLTQTLTIYTPYLTIANIHTYSSLLHTNMMTMATMTVTVTTTVIMTEINHLAIFQPEMKASRSFAFVASTVWNQIICYIFFLIPSFNFLSSISSQTN